MDEDNEEYHNNLFGMINKIHSHSSEFCRYWYVPAYVQTYTSVAVPTTLFNFNNCLFLLLSPPTEAKSSFSRAAPELHKQSAPILRDLQIHRNLLLWNQ